MFKFQILQSVKEKIDSHFKVLEHFFGRLLNGMETKKRVKKSIKKELNKLVEVLRQHPNDV